MITLALDTTGPWCSCAIVNSHSILVDQSEKIGRGHAERLAPMVADALSYAELETKDIGRIAVCTGPGSFTGLRVALAFARSFALPTKTPVIGISALRAMAAEADPLSAQKIISVINAKRGEVCWAVYENGQEIRGPQTQDLETAKSDMGNIPHVQLVGDGAHLITNKSPIDHVNAPILGWISETLNQHGFPPEPFYARGPDAKLPGGKTP